MHALIRARCLLLHYVWQVVSGRWDSIVSSSSWLTQLPQPKESAWERGGEEGDGGLGQGATTVFAVRPTCCGPRLNGTDPNRWGISISNRGRIGSETLQGILQMQITEMCIAEEMYWEAEHWNLKCALDVQYEVECFKFAYRYCCKWTTTWKREEANCA